jgi:hypothetical protein
MMVVIFWNEIRKLAFGLGWIGVEDGIIVLEKGRTHASWISLPSNEARKPKPVNV